MLARYARNTRLADALQQWALSSLRGSPGARAYYDRSAPAKISHQAALRRLANRNVGILHGCLKTRTLYDENTAWGHHHPAAKPVEPLRGYPVLVVSLGGLASKRQPRKSVDAVVRHRPANSGNVAHSSDIVCAGQDLRLFGHVVDRQCTHRDQDCRGP